MGHLAIIGGGAAGLMAAYRAAQSGAKVTVFERNLKPARKLMITGKGRCNVTNNCPAGTVIENTPRNGKFLYSALAELPPAAVMRLFEGWGVPLKTERGNRVFPVSDRAVDIVDALVGAAKKAGVKIQNGRVERLTAADNRVCEVVLEDGRTTAVDSVILATGGCSYPGTGSTGDGYRMAEALGHAVVTPTPSLVPLNCHEGFCTELSGLSLKNVNLSIWENGKKKPCFSELGELLFTHFGISGPLVLSASAHLKNPEQGQYRAVIDLKPALSAEQLDRRILRDFEENVNRDFIRSLDALLPKSLIPVVVRRSGIAEREKVHQISREQRRALGTVLKEFSLRITGFRPMEEAVITRGGIRLNQVDPSTMGSKLIKNLFFAGEVLDLDAYTGGFNLQIAFATGWLAGKNAAQQLGGGNEEQR
ncbi:MAG: NAD(P)/FAD-dependent oxidoreductase [Clostridia bacterium]|nr:NAD(P)/FAD-dependent oxidoreductase [Clostridia bacterium]